MERHEFEKKVEEEITPEDWTIIGLIHAFYPGIKDVGGEEQMVYLYKNFGMRIFRDMRQTAEIEALRDLLLRYLKTLIQKVEKEETWEGLFRIKRQIEKILSE